AAEIDPGLAPIDLALLPWRRLEAHRRPFRRLLHGAQRAHEALDRLVAAAIPARLELLEQNACRVPDLGRPRLQVARMVGEQGGENSMTPGGDYWMTADTPSPRSVHDRPRARSEHARQAAPRPAPPFCC